MVEEKEAQGDKKLTLLQIAVTGVQNKIKTKTHPEQTNKSTTHLPKHGQKSEITTPSCTDLLAYRFAFLSQWQYCLLGVLV